MKERLEADPRLHVDVFRENDYYSAQSEQLAHVIRVLGIFLVVVMAVGAVFGALNTMYAAVGRADPRDRHDARPRLHAREASCELPDRVDPPLPRRRTSSAASWRSRSTACRPAPRTGPASARSHSSSASRPGSSLTGLIASIVLGAIGGYFPARNAARRTVTEALARGVSRCPNFPTSPCTSTRYRHGSAAPSCASVRISNPFVLRSVEPAIEAASNKQRARRDSASANGSSSRCKRISTSSCT